MRSKFVVLVVLFSLLGAISIFAQSLRLPRNPDKLVTRADAFWTFMVAGQRNKALDFVIPEKRDAFLSSNAMPIFGAKVVAVDLTDDLLHGAVRVELESMSPETPTNRMTFTITDAWIWKANNWYVDIGDPRLLGAFRSGSPAAPDTLKTQNEIDHSLKLPETAFNLGTVVQGQRVHIDIPVNYDGKLPLVVELATPTASFSVDAENGLTSSSKSFGLFFDTQDWDGAVSVPVHIRFRSGASSAERSVIITGSVFAPIMFRQVPSDQVLHAGDSVSVFVRNNTADRLEIAYISVDGKLDVLKDLKVLEPNQESEAVFRMKAGETPDLLSLVLKMPVSGLTQFQFHFRTGR